MEFHILFLFLPGVQWILIHRVSIDTIGRIEYFHW